MRILVTGAGGFTGKHLVEQAVKKGHEVIPLKADLTKPVLLKEEISSISPDAVVHLAAISFVGHESAEDFYRVNVVGTMNLLNALVKQGLSDTRILIASSANIYGTPEVDAIHEGIAPAPVNHYAGSKLVMEHMVKTLFDELPIIIARPFNYTGVNQAENFLIPKIVSHFKRKEAVIELGNLDVYRDFSDVRDVVSAYIKLLESSVSSVTVNVCSGGVVSLRDVVSRVAKIANHDIDVRVNPKFVRVNEIAKLVGDNGYLKELIGYTPMYSFDDTLKAMLAG